MISVLIFSSFEAELKNITNQYRSIAADSGNDEWSFFSVRTGTEADKAINTAINIDIACIDVTGNGGIVTAELVRKKFRSCAVVLITDESVSPLTYIRPSILASSLLMRPLRQERVCTTLREVYEVYMRDRQDNYDDSFLFENRDGRQIIPYSSIFYFEAREKKIVIGTEFEELNFYGTLDTLEGQLPEDFVRCHRSFIVSVKKISSVKFSSNTIKLANGCMLPLSRTYKNAVREAVI